MRQPRAWRPSLLAAILLLAALQRGAAAADTGPTVIHLHYTQKDQQTGRYQYVPFEVGSGTTRFDVEYRYDKAGDVNALDVGLMEPGPLHLGTRAFRGWTGDDRDRFFVGVADATPGYWPGPIPAGRWHLVLGLYKVGAPGVDVELSIRTSDEAAVATPALPARPKEPIRSGQAWWSGALHAHTVHSDGILTARALAEKARAEGLDFLAVTDHNNTTHQRETLDVLGLLPIVGEEVTTPGGHASVWGLGGPRDFVDFRAVPGEAAIDTIVRSVHDRGALFAINHPFADCFACSWTHAIGTGIDGIEISNPRPEGRQQALALWDTLLREGRHVTAVGSSDWHRGQAPLGTASVRVWAAELSTRAILDGIRGGRVVVMVDPRTPPPELVARAGRLEGRIGDTIVMNKGELLEIAVGTDAPAYDGAKIELVWRGEVVDAATPKKGSGLRFERYPMTDGYLRVHATRPDGAPLALTNPIWIKIADN